MQCAHQSRNGMCVASCSSLSLCVGLFLGPALTRQSGAANSPSSSILSPSSSDMSSCSSPIPFNSFFPRCSKYAQCCRPYRLVESGLTTHCPCQLKTGPVSSRQIHMSIVYTPLFTSNLITVPSLVFRMCRFFSSSTTVFPARTTFCIEMRGFENIRAPECYAPLNALVCLERNSLRTQVLDLLSICCHKLFRRCLSLNLDMWEHRFRHYMTCGSRVHCGL